MKEVTVQELKSLKDSQTPFQLIDVREIEEKQIADIGGELIPVGTLESQIQKIQKHKKVIVYCRSGKRSGNAAEYLEKKYGFTNVFSLKGGILQYADEIDPTLTKY